MKKLLFLATMNLNDQLFNIGDTRKFTCVSKGTNSKNPHYLPQSLIDKIVEDKVAVIVDPDEKIASRMAIMEDYFSMGEKIKGDYKLGLLTDAEVLHRTLLRIASTRSALDAVDTCYRYNEEKLQDRIYTLQEAHRLELKAQEV